MAQTYTYPITAFPNDAVNLINLEEDIEKDIITPVVESTSHEGLVHITFTQALTGTEETDLDVIVATHDGEKTIPVELTFTAEREKTFTSTASAYTKVLSLSASIPPGGQGIYRLQWFTLYGIDSGLVNFRMRLTQDDEEIPLMGYTEEVPNSDPDERIPRSGFIPLKNLKKGDHHFDLECGKQSDGEEAWKIFKAFMELRRII
jgi:hypothetical protein